MTIEFEQDIAPTDAATNLIATLVKRQLELQGEIAEAEAALKLQKEALRQVEEKELPDALTAAGVDEIKMSDGTKIGIENGMAVSVPKHRMGEVCEWLRNEGHGDIIKSEIKVNIPKGLDESVVKQVFENLDQLGLQYDSADTVHTQTLKALLKEQRSKGKHVDLDLFGAYPYRKASVKLPK